MAAMKPYTIIVETAITRADGREFWRDVMTWTGVDEDTRLWLAGSCKTALFRLVGVPEVAAGPSYTLAYRTLVMEGGRVISDTTLVEFPRLSYESVVAFQLWAMDELREMHRLLVEKHDGLPVATRPRNRLRALLSVVWQSLRGRRLLP